MGLTRRRAAGGVAMFAAAAALMAAALPAAAAPPAPAPIDDDFNFLQLGVLAERVSVELYREALESDDWSRAQRAELRTLRRSDARHERQLVEAMGDEAPVEGDFDVVLPRKALRTKGGVLGLARSLERLAVSVYTAAAHDGQDPGTRLLLAKLLAQDVQHLSTLALIRGNSPITALPGAIGPERAAVAIDRFLVVPQAPEIPDE
jgi:ferritin-like protein